MKALVWSDGHIHTWKSFGISEDSVISRRLQNQVEILKQIDDLIVEHEIPLQIFGGDLFHKVGEIPVECINIVRDWVNKVEKYCKIVWVRGNHDLISDVVYHQYRDAINFLEKDHSKVVRFGDLSICTIGYHEVVDYDKIKGYDLVILHKQPALINEYGHRFKGVDWKTLAENNKLVLFGHYHKKVRLADNCFTIAPPLPLTFDDVGDRGVYIIDTDGINSTLKCDFEVIGGLAVAFIPLKSPKFVTVKTEAEVLDDGNYYRVLNATKKIDNANVLSVVQPPFFDERIKSDDFNTILREWLSVNNKDETYLEMIKDIITDKINTVKQLFKGRLASVVIEDFISVGKMIVPVENGFTLVSGINLDTNDSNGCGKSSIFEAIYWCLFGETTKGLTGDDVIRRGQKNCTVSLELEYENTLYTVTRSRKHGLKVVIVSGVGGDVGEQNLTDGLRLVDAQQLLEGILGFDKTVFLASCYFSQENLVMLTGLSDGDKTEMITNLLGFDKYDDLYLKVFEKIKKFTTRIDELGREKTVQESNIARNKSNVVLINGFISQSRLHIETLKSEIEGYRQQAPATNIEEELQAHTAKEDNLSRQHEEVSKNYDIKTQDVQAVRLSKATNDAEWRGKISESAKVGIKIKSFKALDVGAKCDKCGAMITQENVQLFIDESTREFDKLSLECDEYQAKATDLDQRIAKLDAEADVLYSEKNSLYSELGRVRAEIKSLIQAKGEADKNLALIKACEGEIAGTEKQIEKEIEKRDKANDEILSFDDKITELDWQVEKTKAGLEVLEFWKFSFSPQGIRALLLDRFCNEFNSTVNTYLSTASNGTMSVAVTPTKTLKSGEARNKIGMDIYTGGEAVKYESLSGGEKRRVDVALCLTLNKWISQKYGLSNGLLSLLILDEVFSYIDASGEESVATLLYNEGLNKAVFVVSHTADLGSYAERVLTIIKEHGISRMAE